MSIIQDILLEYSQMRQNGLDSKGTLRALRPYIEPLPENYKAELAQQLRQWELVMQKSELESPSTKREPTPPNPAPVSEKPVEAPPVSPKHLPSLKPLQPEPEPKPKQSEAEALLKGLKPGATWVACPNCSAKNKVSEIFCYACGHLIDSGQGFHSTRSFADGDSAAMPPEYFGKESILRLQIRDTGSFFKLRPQQHAHEIVIGRSSSNSAMAPDVDLSDQQAEQFGVSRLHLAIEFDSENSRLIAYDLGSANSSFINGHKLHPSEKRVLCNGDQLRLAKMVILVIYDHPGSEIQ